MSNPGEIIATFEYLASGVKHNYKSTSLGGLYRQTEGGYATASTPAYVKWDQDDINAGAMRVIVAPKTLYHCWHICMCDDCVLVGGRVFDHSQGSFNGHLKRTPNDRLFTFPSAE